MADLIQIQPLVDSLKKGEDIPVKLPVVDSKKDSDPSAVGGLAALAGVTLATAAGLSRIPGVRQYFKELIPTTKKVVEATKKTPEVMVNKEVEIGNIPTATGQSSELVVQSPQLPRARSRMGEAINNPLNFGKPYNQTVNPVIQGSSAYDRALEAPFETAPAKDWIKWFKDANRSDLRYSSGPLTGVSRRVNPEELEDANLLIERGKEPIGGFLKYAADSNMSVPRELLLEVIRGNPVNKIKTLRLEVPGSPENTFTSLYTKFSDLLDGDPNLRKAIPAEDADYMASSFRNFINKSINTNRPLEMEDINTIQRRIVDASRRIEDPTTKQKLADYLKEFNKATGEYNQLNTKPTDPDIAPNISSFYPKNRDKRGYHLSGGENYAEDVLYVPGKIPNTRRGKFDYLDASPHYLSNTQNEIAFVRYDDLPNPMLDGKRHMRVHELQTDIHSPQFSQNADTRESYFSKKINPYNQDISLKLLNAKRKEITDKLQPYLELGRGQTGLTRSQQQDLARLNYKLTEIDRSSLGGLSRAGVLDGTTGAPLSRSYADFTIKNLMRKMAEKNINAISITPSTVNSGIKMFDKNKFGNEINYGLNSGKALLKDKKTGQVKESSELSVNNKTLSKIAKDYGAVYKQMKVPRSNPYKEWKVIIEREVPREAVESKRAIYDFKGRNSYFFDDHVAAFDTEKEANIFARTFGENSKVKNFKIDDARNYYDAMTLYADNNILKKFLLPQRAYYSIGGFVDETNIFKPII
jgi:hypothetical protein